MIVYKKEEEEEDAGVNVNYPKDANKYGEVLWIQTDDMVTMLNSLFQCDTHVF